VDAIPALRRSQKVFAAAAVEVSRKEAACGATAFIVNVTSGTPQMKVMWRWLVLTGVLEARLLQVREGRFVEAPGDSRVREIVLPDASMIARPRVNGHRQAGLQGRRSGLAPLVEGGHWTAIGTFGAMVTTP
jgi:hypothetical protein